jgi:hypothetical protein
MGMTFGWAKGLDRRDVADRQIQLAGMDLAQVIYDENDPTVAYLLGTAGDESVTYKIVQRPYSTYPLVERLAPDGSTIDQGQLPADAVEQIQQWARYEMATVATPPNVGDLDLTPTPMVSWSQTIEQRPDLGKIEDEQIARAEADAFELDEGIGF